MSLDLPLPKRASFRSFPYLRDILFLDAVLEEIVWREILLASTM